MKSLVLLTFSVLLVSCGTHSVLVETDPVGADILLVSKGKVPQKIGVTPMTLTEKEIPIGREPIMISVGKNGYVTESVIIPASTVTQSTSVSFKMKTMQEALHDKGGNAVEQNVDEVAKQVAQSMRLIGAKDYPSAERSLQVMITKYPQVSTFHALLGNVFYLQRDYDRALISYKKAYAIDPLSTDLDRMIKRIEGVRGSGSRQ